MLLVCIESEEVLLPFELQQPSLSVGKLVQHSIAAKLEVTGFTGKVDWFRFGSCTSFGIMRVLLGGNSNFQPF